MPVESVTGDFAGGVHQVGDSLIVSVHRGNSWRLLSYSEADGEAVELTERRTDYGMTAQHLDQVFFTQHTGSGQSLWRTNGTPEGTVEVPVKTLDELTADRKIDLLLSFGRLQ